MKQILSIFIVIALQAFHSLCFAQEMDVFVSAAASLNIPAEKQEACKSLGLESYMQQSLIRGLYQNTLGEFEPLHSTETAKIKEGSEELYGAKKTIQFIRQFSQIFFAKTQKKIIVTGITKNQSENQDLHCTHHGGYSFDFRPMPGDTPTSWQSSDGSYSRELTKNAIWLLLKSPLVKKIYFNDPEILQDPKIQTLLSQRAKDKIEGIFEELSYEYTFNGEIRKVGHDNHIHVEIQTDDEVSNAFNLAWPLVQSALTQP
jgi:hypothetical protein